VVLDVAQSGADFRFATARAMHDHDVLPDTLSSDLNRFNEGGPVHSLVEVMSKLLALGVPLASVVAMVTANPARVLHLDHEIGSLAPGREADVSVLRMVDGPAVLSDGFESVTVDRRLVPVGCLRAGTWIDADAHAVSPAPLAA
jgi:dihydroorotase